MLSNTWLHAFPWLVPKACSAHLRDLSGPHSAIPTSCSTCLLLWIYISSFFWESLQRWFGRKDIGFLHFSSLWWLMFLYWVTLSLFILITLASNAFGLSQSKACFFRNHNQMVRTLELSYFNIASMAVIIYCAIISILVVLKLHSEKPSSPPVEVGIDPSAPWERTYSVFGAKCIICRTTVYPIACFLSAIGYNIYIIYGYFEVAPPSLKIWAGAGLASTWILNFLAFLIDPYVLYAIPKLFQKAFPAVATYGQHNVYLDEPQSTLSYPNLPKPVSETGINPWQQYTMVKNFIQFMWAIKFLVWLSSNYLNFQSP